MADVRALLAREREARRIHHPHLSYSKSGALTCTVCSLNVKSEALWEGHLKSSNHRKNLQAATAGKTNGVTSSGGKKRKIEEITTPAVAEAENPRKRKTGEDGEGGVEDGEGRKKRHVSFQTPEDQDAVKRSTQPATTEQADVVLPGFVREEATAATVIPQQSPQVGSSPPPPIASTVDADIDESEWAAFNAEIAPLTQAQQTQPQDYSSATISAAPISAAELAAQQAAEERRNRKDLEAEDEKEESAQRLAEEFDIMEEMEARVKRLKEKREALRRGVPPPPPLPADDDDDDDPITSTAVAVGKKRDNKDHEELTKVKLKPPAYKSENDSEEDDDVDDWYL